MVSAGLLTVGLLATVPASPAFAAVACSASYSQAWVGGNGFGGNINITNLGDPLTSWTVTFTFTAGQTIQNGWNGQFSQALRAFYDEMTAQGVQDNVTTFSLSDFGRTLLPSGTGSSVGSDHAWGNHMFVLGGSVLGHAHFGPFVVSSFQRVLQA